jgi:4-hydroxymandelate oxidase
MFDLPSLFDPSLTWADIEEVATWTDLPVVVKGVLHPQDALAAAEHGAAAVVVSNHGGRQLDGVPAGAVALAAVADAVQGAVPLLVDGGVRRGTDAIRARALGADAVLVGRPILYGLATAGALGGRRLGAPPRRLSRRGFVSDPATYWTARCRRNP